MIQHSSYCLLAIVLAMGASAHAQPLALDAPARAHLEAEQCVNMAAYPSCAVGKARQFGQMIGRAGVCGLHKKSQDDFLLPLTLVYALAHDKTDFDRALDSYKIGTMDGAALQVSPMTALPCAPLLSMFENLRSTP